MYKLCTRCYGTGSFFGQGMMPQNCNCEDIIHKKTDVCLKDIDVKSDSYKSAINDIMKLNPKMSKKEATKIFNETYDKV